MVRRLGIGFFILVMLCSGQVMAIDAVIAHAIFYEPRVADNGKLTPGVTTSWQINPHSLHFTTTPEKTIIARIKTDILFTNDAGVIKEDHFILQTKPGTDVSDLAALNILDQRHYFITPGMVHMKFVLTDMADTTSRFVYRDSFLVAPAAATAFYSDLQLLDTSFESSSPTIFYRKGRQVVPACTNFLDESRSALHYYAELYQSATITKDDFPLVQRICIAKKEKSAPSGAYIHTDTILTASDFVASGTFPIATLGSGNYYLNVSLINKTGVEIAAQSLFFQRMNPHPHIDSTKKADVMADTAMESVTVLDLSKTFVAKYTLPQLKAMLKMLLPTSDPMHAASINSFLKKPDDLYMRYYIYNHFAAINKKDPGKAWKEFSANVLEVNKRFTEHGIAGYETDRGIIFLRYGEPTEIISVENETGSLPYEIWQYNTLTQMNHKDIADAVFLFYKPNDMLAGFRILHSNVSGEAMNKSWRSYLYVSSEGGNNSNTNSRADQYIGNK